MILNAAGEAVRVEVPVLKSCPFCGGTNIQPESIDGLQGRGLWYRCQTCSCTGGYDFSEGATRPGVADRWNARVLEIEIRKKTLEEALQFLDMHTPNGEGVTAAITLCFKVLRTELVKLSQCKDMSAYLSEF